MFFHKLSMWRWALRIPFSLPFPPLVVIYDRYLSLLNPIVPFKTKPYHIRSTQVPNPLFATGLSSLLARPSALVAPAVVCPPFDYYLSDHPGTAIQRRLFPFSSPLQNMLSTEERPSLYGSAVPMDYSGMRSMKQINGALQPQHHNRHIWIITGPAGCGKTTVTQHLAKELSIPYIEGDDVRTDPSPHLSDHTTQPPVLTHRPLHSTTPKPTSKKWPRTNPSPTPTDGTGWSSCAKPPSPASPPTTRPRPASSSPAPRSSANTATSSASPPTTTTTCTCTSSTCGWRTRRRCCSGSRRARAIT